MGGLGVSRRRFSFRALKQRGLNMVDLMVWMIIGAMISTFAIQSIQQYRTAAIVYQMKSDLKGAADLALARAVLTGFVTEDEVSYSVDKSKKSDGVTMSWAKFDVQDDNPNNEEDPETTEAPAQASGDGFQMERVSANTSLSIDLASSITLASEEHSDVVVDKTFVLVAKHEEAPNIRVMYFFDEIHVYHEGPQEFPVEALPPVQDMPSDNGSDKEKEKDTSSPEPATEQTTAPTTEPSPEQTPEPEPTSTEEASEPATEPEPVPSASPSSSTEPAPSSSPAPAETTAPSSPQPSTAPSEDPTPEPQPLTPAENYNPKTKEYLFCHGDQMHSNSFRGMVEGHEHHSNDIMPPIPTRDYPGFNWNSDTAKIYYNNCKPVTK